MVELSNEKIDRILHKETAKSEELKTILRSIYTRYMHLFEKYYADINALDDDGIAELKKYHEETLSLVKYYYMDIPLDICAGIKEFENKYTACMLGPEWHKYLSDIYEDFKEDRCYANGSEEYYKAAFTREALDTFYETMDYILRDGFGTDSQTYNNIAGRITGLLFGKDE